MAWTSLLLVGLVSRLVPAQVTRSFELGTSHLTQDGFGQTGAVTGGMGYSAMYSRVVHAADVVTAFGGGRHRTGRAAASFAVYSEPFSRTGFESAVLASFYSATARAPSSTFLISLRQVNQGFRRGSAWGVTTGVRVWESEPFPVATAQISHWRDRPTGVYSAAITGFVVSPDRLSPKRFGYVQGADLAGGWKLTRRDDGSVISVSGGMRFGFGNLEERPRWLEASITRPIAHGVSFVIAGGRTPHDFVRGILATRYYSASLRGSFRTARVATPGRTP